MSIGSQRALFGVSTLTFAASAAMTTHWCASLVPMLWRYRETVGKAGATRLGHLTALVSAGYITPGYRPAAVWASLWDSPYNLRPPRTTY